MTDHIETKYNPENDWEAHGQGIHMLTVQFFCRTQINDPALLN